MKMLTSKLYGSCAVIERAGVVAYKLELPLKVKVHPIFRMIRVKAVRFMRIRAFFFPSCVYTRSFYNGPL